MKGAEESVFCTRFLAALEMTANVDDVFFNRFLAALEIHQRPEKFLPKGEIRVEDSSHHNVISSAARNLNFKLTSYM